MDSRNTIHISVLKFCLKLVYPNLNATIFLVYLAIKYRYFYRKKITTGKTTDIYTLKICPKSTIQRLIRENVTGDMSKVLGEKCVIISKVHFVLLSAVNFFYRDNGVLWITMKIPSDTRKKVKEQANQKDKYLKSNLDKLTSEIHKKLWPECNEDSLRKVRIVPVVGCKLVPDNIAYTTEEEFANISSSFGLSSLEEIDVSFGPLLSYEFGPKIATHSRVNIIESEYPLKRDILKVVISNYFAIPKLVSVDDVISIDLTPTVLGNQFNKAITATKTVHKVYIVCKNLAVDSKKCKRRNDVIHALYIVKGVTEMILGDSINVIKPKKTYCSTENIKHLTFYGAHICPDGLREKFDRIQESITPFLTGDIDKFSSTLNSPILPILLVTGPSGAGKDLLIKLVAEHNGLNYLPVDCNIVQCSTAKATEAKIESVFEHAVSVAPVILSLRNFEIFAVDQEHNEDPRILEYFIDAVTKLFRNNENKPPIIVIAITEKTELKPNVMRIFLERIHITKPSPAQRYEILRWFSFVMNLSVDDKSKGDFAIIENQVQNDMLQRVAAKTETFLYGDIDTLMHFAMRESYMKQSNSYFNISLDPNLSLLQEEDYNNALEAIRTLQSQHLDAPKIPKVYWEDIGGLEMLKKELLKTIEFPIKFPHLFKNSALKRSGILLYGPPGCGKTLVAKAVSTELNVSFMSVKGPELMNMYIGQSEENVRDVFRSARAASPCIVFLDELDSLAPARDSAADAGGASDRIVSQLLAELDGVTTQPDADESSFVFVMGATNRPDLLDPSLLRPGRLDKCIYVGPYSGLQEKTSVLKALCRNYKLLPDVKMEDIAASLPDRCTGADLLQVVSTAKSTAIRNLVAKQQAGLLKENELTTDAVILGMAEFKEGVKSFRASVTEEELRYYESLQNQL